MGIMLIIQLDGWNAMTCSALSVLPSTMEYRVKGDLLNAIDRPASAYGATFSLGAMYVSGRPRAGYR